MTNVGLTNNYFGPSQGVLQAPEYQFFDRQWITVPYSSLIYGIQLGPAIDSGMVTRRGVLLRLAASRSPDFVPTWAGTDLQSHGWVEADLVRQALAAQTSSTVMSLQNIVAARQATIYNTGVKNG